MDSISYVEMTGPELVKKLENLQVEINALDEKVWELHKKGDFDLSTKLCQKLQSLEHEENYIRSIIESR